MGERQEDESHQRPRRHGFRKAGPIELCSISTTDANELSRPIHDRMPVNQRGADAEAWINPGIDRSLLEVRG
jgi:putative SOS response-associated peptidase YedK